MADGDMSDRSVTDITQAWEIFKFRCIDLDRAIIERILHHSDEITAAERAADLRLDAACKAHAEWCSFHNGAVAPPDWK